MIALNAHTLLKWSAIHLAMLILMLASVTCVMAQTTAFRYQGRLVQAGVPANGQYDFAMTLWDQSAAGTQIGQTLTLSAVSVSEGSFTAVLDFGVNAFNGSDRYLEISVRVSGDPQATFQPLSPRQQVTSTPYAIKSVTAGTADALSSACVSCVSGSQIGSIATDQISTGTLPANRGGTGLSATGPSGSLLRSDGTTWTTAPLQVADVPDLGGSYVRNGSVQQTANFNISGNGTAGGTLSGNTVNTKTQYNLNNQRILSVAGNANLFVGGNTGTLNTGNNNSFFGNNSGAANSTGSLNAFFGSDTGSSNTSGANNSFYGYHAGQINSTGNNNSFFGSNSGRNSNIGFNNAFFGKDSGFGGTSTHDNAFFGYGAGYSNTSNLNSFFGSGSGSANTSGTSNSFFGYSAGSHNLAGNGNSFFGTSAGLSNASGVNNTFVGLESGSFNTSGANNTAIGANASTKTENLVNATALGAFAQVSANNSLVLGSINGINGATADTKVGIGTSAPTERLTIKTPSHTYGFIQTDGGATVGSYVGGTGAQPYGGWLGTKSNHPLSFFVNNGGAAVTIETSGFLRLNNVDAGGSLQLCLGNSNHISFCSSSLRYKTDVKRFTGGLNVVNRLQPITFSWKQGGMRDVGFGAEEVAKVEPLLTFRNPSGQIEGVKYNQITAVLVNAVKEQQDQISAQQKQLNNLSRLEVENRQLRTQLGDISRRLARMEQRHHRRR